MLTSALNKVDTTPLANALSKFSRHEVAEYEMLNLVEEVTHRVFEQLDITYLEKDKSVWEVFRDPVGWRRDNTLTDRFRAVEFGFPDSFIEYAIDYTFGVPLPRVTGNSLQLDVNYAVPWIVCEHAALALSYSGYRFASRHFDENGLARDMLKYSNPRDPYLTERVNLIAPRQAYQMLLHGVAYEISANCLGSSVLDNRVKNIAGNAEAISVAAAASCIVNFFNELKQDMDSRTTFQFYFIVDRACNLIECIAKEQSNAEAKLLLNPTLQILELIKTAIGSEFGNMPFEKIVYPKEFMHQLFHLGRQAFKDRQIIEHEVLARISHM
jgi:hypothetical protein